MAKKNDAGDGWRTGGLTPGGGDGETDLTPKEIANGTDYDIARKAWEQGMAVRSIIHELGWEGGANAANTMKVKRALTRAARHGILTLTPPPMEHLKTRLTEKLKGLGVPTMKDLHVEWDHNAACHRAAMLLDKEIRDFLWEGEPRRQLVVANAGGGTVSLICDHLQRLAVLPPPKVVAKDLIFVSLNVAEARERFDEGANFLAVRLARIYGGRHLTVIMSDIEAPMAGGKPHLGSKRQKWMETYGEAIAHIDLLVTSAGKFPGGKPGAPGFLAQWLAEEGLEFPRGAIGDIAFNFIDSKGYPVDAEPRTADLIKSLIRPEPTWDGLDHLFRTDRVLLVLTGEKVGLARALIAGAHATRCVVDTQVASGLLRDEVI